MSTQHFCNYLKGRNKKRASRKRFDRENKIYIGARPTIFTKFFSEHDRVTTLRALRNATRVVFVDTPPTDELVATIEALVKDGKEVFVRDHHNISGEAKSPRDREIQQNAEKITQLLGGNAVLSNRMTHPACSSLIQTGEFDTPGTVLVADPDADGLTAAMTAAGITYSSLHTDAAILDGPRAFQTKENLSSDAHLLTQAMGALPSFDVKQPHISEKAKSEVFSHFVAMVQGSTPARMRLMNMAKNYERKVTNAITVARGAQEVAKGVVFADTRGHTEFDQTTLIQSLEQRTGVRVTIIAKDNGPISSQHEGGQYTLAIPRAMQKEINIQEFLPDTFSSSPEAGIICNTTFMAHVSHGVFQETILPKLQNPNVDVAKNEGVTQKDTIQSLAQANLERLKRQKNGEKIEIKTSGAKVLTPRSGDEQLVARARAARIERGLKALDKKRAHEEAEKKKRAEKALEHVRERGAFNRSAAEQAPKVAPGNKTNIPGQGPPKGPSGGKQVFVNEKNRLKRERKAKQKKK